jgi:hypothetical protein
VEHRIFIDSLAVVRNPNLGNILLCAQL